MWLVFLLMPDPNVFHTALVIQQCLDLVLMCMEPYS